METALRNYLKGQAELTAVLGASPFRWYAQMIPQSIPLPAVMFQTNSVDRTDSYHQGGRGEHCTRNMSVRVYSVRYVEAREIWELIRMKVDGYSGSMAGVRVQFIRITSETDGFEPPADEGKQGEHYVDATLQIEHQELAPTFG